MLSFAKTLTGSVFNILHSAIRCGSAISPIHVPPIEAFSFCVPVLLSLTQRPLAGELGSSAVAFRVEPA
jgi:hypothetical protein